MPALEVPTGVQMSGGWSAFALSVPDIKVSLASLEVYDYKLPYYVPQTSCCARNYPSLYCFDVYCCCCFNASLYCFDVCCCSCCCFSFNAFAKKAGSPAFVDLVNMKDGHQIRHRAEKKCCRTPRVFTFMDGQYLGHVSRTMRCGNRCLTCLEDFRAKPVLQVALHNAQGRQAARIDRNGKGSCCVCRVGTPMKCTGCCFNILNLSCAVRPAVPSLSCGLLDCDPVCCDCCVRGDHVCCACVDCVCCCIGLPMPAPSCWCCCPSCETRPFRSDNTITFQDFKVVDSQSRATVGKLESQFRGNYPSAYTHKQTTPFKVSGAAVVPAMGALLSGLAAGMVYPMGMRVPAFSGVEPEPEGKSPNFSGFVEAELASQMRRLVGLSGGESLLREDLVVMDDMVLALGNGGCQVKGWRLVELGYHASPFTCCGYGIGGEVQPPIFVKSRDMARDLVKGALEATSGEKSVTFQMRFQLPDQDKPIVTANSLIAPDKKFNPPWGGFATQLEEVSLACTYMRCWRFPCNFTQKQIICCRVPCYARPMKQRTSEDESRAAGLKPAPAVMMVGVPRQAWMD